MLFIVYRLLIVYSNLTNNLIQTGFFPINNSLLKISEPISPHNGYYHIFHRTLQTVKTLCVCENDLVSCFFVLNLVTGCHYIRDLN